MRAVQQPSTLISEAEREARIDLAACHRLAVQFGLQEGIDNHFTSLVPGSSNEFLLAPFGLHWSEVKASDFMVVSFSGRVVRGAGAVEDTALCIHLPVHRRCAHARCVLHTHMPHATALSLLEDPRIEMTGQSAVMFHEQIAYYDYNGLAFDQGEGERMAAALGDKSVLMLRNHGVLVVGDSLAQAFERLYFLERVAQLQILALSTGRPMRPIPDAVIQATLAQYAAGTQVGGQERTQLHFDALKRLLDRVAPDYTH
jgi:ribulose-5-phosphate 4-epimerase/fuculose-1-phosphate aldolase